MYCKCGAEIKIDSRWNGLCDVVTFLHDGKEIYECPNCQEHVTAWLEAKNDNLVYRKGALLSEPPVSEVPVPELSKDELSLLLYCETRAVDHRGGLSARQLNASDLDTLEQWNDSGFVRFGRISARTRARDGSTHWCELSEQAWQIAHAERKARAARMGEERTWLTSEESRYGAL